MATRRVDRERNDDHGGAKTREPLIDPRNREVDLPGVELLVVISGANVVRRATTATVTAAARVVGSRRITEVHESAPAVAVRAALCAVGRREGGVVRPRTPRGTSASGRR